MLDHFGFVLSKLVLLGLVFFQYRPRPAEPRDWLGRTSSKWVGRQTLLRHSALSLCFRTRHLLCLSYKFYSFKNALWVVFIKMLIISRMTSFLRTKSSCLACVSSCYLRVKLFHGLLSQNISTTHSTTQPKAYTKLVAEHVFIASIVYRPIPRRTWFAVTPERTSWNYADAALQFSTYSR